MQVWLYIEAVLLAGCLRFSQWCNSVLHASNLLTLFIISGLECSIIDRNETVSACLGCLTAKLTLVHWYIRTCNYCFWEPPVKPIWTRVVSMNMSLMWILLGVRQPNYPFLPSDLSHMGSYQRMDLWLICCTHATYAFGKMMDSSKFAFENWWLKQIMLSKFGGLKQIMLSNMNGLKQTSFQNWWTQAKYAFAN